MEHGGAASLFLANTYYTHNIVVGSINVGRICWQIPHHSVHLKLLVTKQRRPVVAVSPFSNRLLKLTWQYPQCSELQREIPRQGARLSMCLSLLGARVRLSFGTACLTDNTAAGC